MKQMNCFSDEHLCDFVTDVEIRYTNRVDNINLIIDKSVIDNLTFTRRSLETSKGEYYVEESSLGICLFGFNGKDQWWSSNCERINGLFETNYTEIAINHCVYGIDLDVLNEIIRKFNVPVRYNLKLRD